MQCSELREIADSCLSDVSVMNSNNEALEHLEQCGDCLVAIADRLNLLFMLRAAVMQTPTSQMSDEFGTRLRARLRVAPFFWFPT